jgi:hypothetical protein
MLFLPKTFYQQCHCQEDNNDEEKHVESQFMYVYVTTEAIQMCLKTYGMRFQACSAV